MPKTSKRRTGGKSSAKAPRCPSKKQIKKDPVDEALWPTSTIRQTTTITRTDATKLYRLSLADIAGLQYSTVKPSKPGYNPMFLYKERDIEIVAWRKHGGPDNFFSYLEGLHKLHNEKQQKKLPAERKPFSAPSSYINCAMRPQGGVAMPGNSRVRKDHHMKTYWTATPRLLQFHTQIPRWVWLAMTTALGWDSDSDDFGRVRYRSNEDKERVIRLGVEQLVYPQRPAQSLPPSTSVNALRAVLNVAPKKSDNLYESVQGIEKDEDHEGTEWLFWAESYLEKLYPALVEVVLEHGIGDAGWKSIRWEVYDTYTKCIGGIYYRSEGMRSCWCDQADAWLCGRPNSLLISKERMSKCGKEYTGLLPLTNYRGLV